jgi:ABC-type multidrug transport system fused ATPase/permease subunit
MASSKDVLTKGLRLMVQAIREEPRIFTVAVGGACLAALITVGSAYIVGALVARVALPAIERGHPDGALLAVAAAVLVGLSMFKVVGIFCRRLGGAYLQMRLQASYRKRVTRRYLDLPPMWHRQHATGTLLSNASSDVDTMWLPTATLAYALATVVMLVAALVSLFLTDWVIAMVGVAIFPTLFGIYSVYSRQSATRYARVQQLRGEVSAIAHESFDGALVVKAMGREAHETERFAAKVGEMRDELIGIGRIRGRYDPILDSLPSVGTLAVLLIGSWRLSTGAIGVSELVSAAFLFALLDMPVRAIGWLLTGIPGAVAGWDRVRAVLEATGELRYGTAEPAGTDSATSVGQLRFEQVSFGYQPEQPVLHDISFAVPAGQVVALVGPTGSGKSTIASLAMRLVDPAAGTVQLDGQDLRELTAAALAANVALVPQVPFAFDDTVRANVSLDRAGIDDEQVWWALRLAQADGFVARLSSSEPVVAEDPATPRASRGGLDTMLGERGVLLSGGQRQRLTLARALAGRPRLLVLDDATSAVDPSVEAAILDGLRDTDFTMLVIAYRRATIALADRVVYIERGRVVATGTHDELLATVAGYAELVTAYEREEAERIRRHTYEEVVPA